MTAAAAQPYLAQTPVTDLGPYGADFQGFPRDLARLAWVVQGRGLAEVSDDVLTPSDLALLDRLAVLSQAGDDGVAELRALYERDGRLRPDTTSRTPSAETRESSGLRRS